MKAKIISWIISVSFVLTLTTRLQADDSSEPHHKPNAKAWKSDRERAKKAVEQNHYSEAEQFYKAAVAEARNFGAKDDRLADSVADLGSLYVGAHEYTLAEPVFRELVEIRRRDPNPTLEETALLNYGYVLLANRNFDEAITTYKRLEAVMSQKYGSDHPYVAESRLYLADAYFQKGDYAQAEPLAKRCAETFQHPGSRLIVRQLEPAGYRMQTFIHRFRPNYVNALEALSMLDAIYVIQKRPADAAESLQECLKVINDNASDKEPLLPDIMTRLGKVYLASSNYPGAETIFTRLVNLREKTLGATNTATLETENRLAGVYEQEHKTVEAGALYQKILATADAAFGVDSRESTSALAKVGRFHFDAGEYEQAEPLYARLRQHTEKFQGLDIALNPILDDQAVIYAKLGKDTELAGVYQQQAAVFEKMFGPNSRALVKPLTNEAAVLRKLKRDAEADALEKRVAAIQAPK